MLDQSRGPRRKIAIIGGGISGLSAAYYLSAHHDVTLFEAADRLGGHARTVLAGKNRDQPVDTGFIVFNYATYPNLTRLFHDLDVPVQKSDMSFCASINDGQLEYGLNSIPSLLAQKNNLLRPGFYRMIRDIIRFGKYAEQTADSDDIIIAELVDCLQLSKAFRDWYLLPMCGAIWSMQFARNQENPRRGTRVALRGVQMANYVAYAVDGRAVDTESTITLSHMRLLGDDLLLFIYIGLAHFQQRVEQ